jgi:hypothetical protein
MPTDAGPRPAPLSLNDRFWSWLFSPPEPNPLWEWMPWRSWRGAQLVWASIGLGALQLIIKHLGGDDMPLLLHIQWALWIMGWALGVAGFLLIVLLA